MNHFAIRYSAGSNRGTETPSGMFRDAPLAGIAVQDVSQEHQRSEPVSIVPLWRSQGLPMCLVYCCGVGETEGLPQWLVRVSRVRDTPWRTLTG